MDVYCLSTQADFSCSACGRCCLDWGVFLEKNEYERLHRALESGELILPRDGRDTPGKALLKMEDGSTKFSSALGRDESGACLFLEKDRGDLCAIQRQLGHAALPMICQVYPRLCILQPLGVFAKLSNWCPTAAGMLFRDDRDLSIVCNPPETAGRDLYVGFDARDRQPPMLRRGVRLSWEGYALWERHAVQMLARQQCSPEEALVGVVISAEKARAWQGPNPPPLDYLRRLFESDSQADGCALKRQIAQLPGGLAPGKRNYDALIQKAAIQTERLRSLVTQYRSAYLTGNADDDTRRFAADYERYVRPVWQDFQRPTRHYLASTLFANNFAYLTDGLRAGLFSVVFALTALRIHCVLACARNGRPLDKDLFLEAIGHTDWMFLHSLSREWLAAFFDLIEPLSVTQVVAPIP